MSVHQGLPCAKGNPLGRALPAPAARPAARPGGFVLPRGGFPHPARWHPRRRRAPVEPIAEPHDVVTVAGGFEVPGVARVASGCHRSGPSARQLAVRIAHRPLTYLPLCLLMPGVTDLRPTFGKAVAHG